MGDQEQNAADLQYKMSKKIAQLTKVVYQLNCRNEDNDSTQRNLAGQYEDEITEIMSDAKSKIQHLKDELDSKREEKKLKQIVDEMTKQHSREKQEAMRIFEDFKNKSAQQEMTVKKGVDERVSAMTADLTAAKENFTKQISFLESKLATTKKEHDATVADLKAKKDEEVNNLVVTYNEKYKAMLAHQLAEQDKLEAQLNKEWGDKLAAMQKSGGQGLADLTKQLQEEQAKVRSLTNETTTLKETVAELERIKVNMDTEVLRMKGRVEQLQEALKVTQTSLVTAENSVANLSSKNETLTDNLEDTLEELKKLTQSHGELTATLEDRDQTVAQLQKELADLREMNDKALAQGGSAAEQVQHLTAKLNESNAKLAELERKLSATQADLKKSEEGRKAAELQVEDLTKRLWALEEAMAELRRSSEAEIAQLKADHNAKIKALTSDSSASAGALASEHEEAMKRLRNDLEKHHADLLSAKQAEWQKKLEGREAELKAQHEQEMADLKAKHQQEIAELEKRHAAALEALAQEMQGSASQASAETQALRKKIQELEQEHAAALQKLTETKDKEIDDLKAANANFTGEVQKKLEAQIADLKQEMKKLEMELANATKQREGLQADLAQEKANQELLKKKHEEDIKALRAQLEKEFNDRVAEAAKSGSASTESKLAELRASLEKEKQLELAKLNQEKAAELEALRKKHAAEVEALEAKIKSLNATIQSLESAGSANSDEHAKALEKLREEMRIADQANRDASKRLKEEHSNALSSLTQEKDTAYRSMESKLVAEIAALKKAHEKALNQISIDSRSAINDLEEAHKNRLISLERRKDEEREATLKEIQEKLSGEMQRANEQHAAEVEQLNQARAGLEKENGILASQSTEHERKWKTSELKAKGLEAELENAKKQQEQQKLDHQAALANLKSEMERKEQEALAAQQAKFTEEKAEIKAATDEEKKKLAEKIKYLKRTVADLEYKYANRESRQEDVAKINSLLKENKEKDDALIKAHNDMKFYKLELVNREESYNKVFGRQPTVQTAADENQAPSGTTAPQQAPSSAPALEKSQNRAAPPNVRRTKSINGQR